MCEKCSEFYKSNGSSSSDGMYFYLSSQTATDSRALSNKVLEQLKGYIETATWLAPFIRKIGLSDSTVRIRKVAHFMIYLVLGFVSYLALPRQWSIKKKMALVVSLCFMYAITDEFHQSFVPGRGPEIRDVFIGTLGFGISRYMIDPTYTSRVSMYVNNNTDRVESQLNINDINASQKLVATYIEILKSDVVLSKVISQMALPYTNEALRGMIAANALNSTEILEVKVTSKDPEEAAAIANTLAELAPPEIIRVVQAGGVELIDEAVPNVNPVSPNIGLNSVIGALLGAVIACLGILVTAMLDTRVKSEGDLQKQYDYIFIDTPPVNVVSDAIVLSEIVSGVIVVTKQNQSKYPELGDAIAKLNFAKAKVLGIILTGATARGGKYGKHGKYKGYEAYE